MIFLAGFFVFEVLFVNVQFLYPKCTVKITYIKNDFFGHNDLRSVLVVFQK